MTKTYSIQNVSGAMMMKPTVKIHNLPRNITECFPRREKPKLILKNKHDICRIKTDVTIPGRGSGVYEIQVSKRTKAF